MKFKNAALDTILFVDNQNFAKLKKATNDSFYYELAFEVDLNEAASKNNSFNGKVFLYNNKKTSTQPILNIDKLQPNKQEKISASQNNLANKTIINNLLTIQTIRKNTVTLNDAQIVLTKQFSLFDVVSIKDIEKAKRFVFEQVNKKIKLTTIKNKQNGLKQVFPNYQTDVKLDSLAVSKLMLSTLNDNKDPGALLKETHGIQSLDSLSSGKFTNYSGLNLLQKSIIGQNSKLSTVSDQTIVPEFEFVTSARKKIILEFEIQKTKLQNFNELIFEIEIYDENGRPTSTKEVMVNHKKQYDLLVFPKHAPKINSVFRDKNQKINCYISQIDDYATNISLYYKEVNSLSGKYYFLGKYNLLKADGEKKIEINKLLNKKIILRAFAEFENTKKSLLFDSVVIDLSKLVNSQEFIPKTSIENIWNYQINEDNTITIDCSIGSYHTDIISCLFYKRIETQDEKTLLLGPSKLENYFFSFKDIGNRKDVNIEYSVEFIKKDGTKIPGQNTLIVFNKEIKTDILTTEILNQKNSITPTNLNVEFELSTILEKKQINLIVDIFKQQGIYDLFKDSIESTDINFSFAYRILRTNEQTGEEVDFGVFEASVFNDLVSSKKRNIRILESGYSYLYKVFTYIRTPSTLLPQLEISSIYKTDSYTYFPYFSRHPFTLKNGTLLTANSIKEQHSESEFSFGPTSKIVYVKADFSKALPSIKNSFLLNLNEELNLLSWSVDGNLDKIDHFIILMNQLGNKKIVAATHAISDTNSFEFINLVKEKNIGEISYSIIPVYFDYSLGQEITTNTIII